MQIEFRCGHQQPVTSNASDPRCGCGEFRVARMVSRVAAPRFTGRVNGPCAEYAPLEAVAVDVTEKGPLPLSVPKAGGPR